MKTAKGKSFNELLESLSHMLINFGEQSLYPALIKEEGLEFAKKFGGEEMWDSCDWYLKNHFENEMLCNMREYNLHSHSQLQDCVSDIINNFKTLTRPVTVTYTEEAMEQARENAYKLAFQTWKKALEDGIDRIELGDHLELNGTELSLNMKSLKKLLYMDVCDMANDRMADAE